MVMLAQAPNKLWVDSSNRHPLWVYLHFIFKLSQHTSKHISKQRAEKKAAAEAAKAAAKEAAAEKAAAGEFFGCCKIITAPT